VNIYLIPYTGMRHVVMGVILASAGLCAWWWVLFLQVQALPFLYLRTGMVWSQALDGFLYVGTLLAVVTSGSMLAEGSLRRRPIRWRIFYAVLAVAIALLLLMINWGMMRLCMPLFTPDTIDELLADRSLVTLRFRIGIWLAAGFAAGTGAFLSRWLHGGITRRWSWGGRDDVGPTPPQSWPEFFLALFAHCGGGLAAGAFAATSWHLLGYYSGLQGDLYRASALAAAVFGGIYGLLVWPIPEDLYVGWVRVLSYERYGLRIPVPHVDGKPAERFVGHFPRGLDLYLPAERGVAELHTSFVSSGDKYTVRGLSIEPTIVRRTLERIDLRYDPRRPAPLETTLKMEDRVLLGPKGETEIEFLMLPKEEQ
jgi:hypothetical protein